MSTFEKDAELCFLVAGDAEFQFGDTSVIREGLGAFIYRVVGRDFAESLVDLYEADCSQIEFGLVVVTGEVLSDHQLVLAQRDVNRALAIGYDLHYDEFRTSDPIFAAIGRCATKLETLEDELRYTLKSKFNTHPSDAADEAPREEHGLLLPVEKPNSQAEALHSLAFAMERHRLLFLYFTEAVRKNLNTEESPTPFLEKVTKDDIPGYQQYMAQVDLDGEFLLKNKRFLDSFADTAIARFGHGKQAESSADPEISTFWILDEGSVSYLQDSSDAIHECATWLRSFDTRGECEHIIDHCLEVAYDHGRTRWYSSLGVRWEYLFRLEEAIAIVKRSAVKIHSHPPDANQNSSSDSDWYYLRMEYEESIYNYDPAVLGVVADDPNYLPYGRDAFAFFKVSDKGLAERLVRLFDRFIKPNVEREEEMRIRITFSSERSGAFDDDELFLIEGEIEGIKSEVEYLDKKWSSTRASEIGESPELLRLRPLEGELHSRQRLYDQARRWCERLGETSAGKVSPARQNHGSSSPQVDECSAIESAADELLRVGLPTAVMAACCLRDLSRIHYYYPGVIEEEESKNLHDILVANFTSATRFCKLDSKVDELGFPQDGGMNAEVELSGLIGALALNHPDFKADPTSSEDLSLKLKESLARCRQDVIEPVRGICDRIQRAIFFDCRIPNPISDPSYQEPQRLLQMLDLYWKVVRKLVILHIDFPIGYRPHPLLDLVISVKSRIDECLSGLWHIDDVDGVKQRIATLLDSLGSGDLDDLGAVPDWSHDQVGSVDQFIVEARLEMGSKFYPLTPLEDVFLSHTQKSADDYERQLKEKWIAFRKGMASRGGDGSGRSPLPTQPTDPTTSAIREKPSQDLKAFDGGDLIFSTARVTLCGAEICSGSRQLSRRIVLELLSQRGRDDTFRAFSGEELETEAKKHGAKGSPSGLIRDLRDNIQMALREHAGIESSRTDIILSGDTGYRLAESLTVQFVDAPLIKDITDTDEDPNVRNKGQQNVPNVYENTAYGRRAWILQKLKEGTRLKVTMVAEQFRVSAKTAQRDLTALKNQGQIEYVGPSRTGFYQLCQNRSPDRESG